MWGPGRRPGAPPRATAADPRRRIVPGSPGSAGGGRPRSLPCTDSGWPEVDERSYRRAGLVDVDQQIVHGTGGDDVELRLQRIHHDLGMEEHHVDDRRREIRSEIALDVGATAPLMSQRCNQFDLHPADEGADGVVVAHLDPDRHQVDGHPARPPQYGRGARRDGDVHDHVAASRRATQETGERGDDARRGRGARSLSVLGPFEPTHRPVRQRRCHEPTFGHRGRTGTHERHAADAVQSVRPVRRSVSCLSDAR